MYILKKRVLKGRVGGGGTLRLDIRRAEANCHGFPCFNFFFLLLQAYFDLAQAEQHLS